jgi:hypothetical protein
MAAAKERLRALRVERESLAHRLDDAHRDLPTVEELLPRLREKIRDLATTLGADLAPGDGSRSGAFSQALPRGGSLDGTRVIRRAPKNAA